MCLSLLKQSLAALSESVLEGYMGIEMNSIFWWKIRMKIKFGDFSVLNLSITEKTNYGQYTNTHIHLRRLTQK